MPENNVHISEPVLGLYLLSQEVNNDYDTYDSCIVAATSEEDAKTIGPTNLPFPDNEKWSIWGYNLEDIKVELIGTAISGTKRGVILASFNAG